MTGVTPSGSGSRAPHEAASASSPKASIPNALAGADNWEVGPCVDRLGHVTSWDINIRPNRGDKGVAVIASVYSGEVVARAILAAIQTASGEARRAALTRMVQLDEELGLYDDEPVAAQGMAPEGRGREGGPGSSELPSPVAKRCAQPQPQPPSPSE